MVTKSETLPSFLFSKEGFVKYFSGVFMAVESWS